MRRVFPILLLLAIPLAGAGETSPPSPGRVYYDAALTRSAESACRAAVPAALEQIGKIFPWLALVSAEGEREQGFTLVSAEGERKQVQASARTPAFSFHAGGAEGTPASPWAGGYYMSDTHTIYIQHVPLLIEQGRLSATVRHECVHAALAAAGSARLPLWLEEGCALHFSGQIIGRIPEGARRAKTLAALDANIRALSEQNDEAAWLEIRASHAQARRIVGAFVQRLGLAHFVNFLRVLKNGTRFDQALASYYALEPEEVNAWL